MNIQLGQICLLTLSWSDSEDSFYALVTPLSKNERGEIRFENQLSKRAPALTCAKFGFDSSLLCPTIVDYRAIESWDQLKGAIELVQEQESLL